MFVYMPRDKRPLFDPYIHKIESEYKMKETHETYRLNELFPEGSCQLTSCD